MPSSKSKNTTRKLRNISDIRRVADLACSHGLLSWALMLLRDLDDQIRREQATAAAAAKDHDSDNDEHNVIEVEIVRPCSAICVDRTMPPSSEKVALAMQEEWPKLAERWDYVEGMILQIEPAPSTLLVGVHCCGQLSDQVIDLAIRGNAPLALVPCCHTYKCLSKEHKQDLRDLNRKEKEMMNQANANGDGALTVDDVVSSMKFQNCNTSLTDFVDSIRIRRLEEAGYHVQEERIPVEFSPKNRIILATPPLTPVPEHVRYQSQYHIRYKPVVTLFNITFKIPVADTEEARHFVRSESGRAAANRRRRRSPPNNSLSLWFPYKDYLSLEQIHDFADKVVSRYGPAIVKEMDEHDLNNPVRPPVLFRHTTREVRDHSTTTDNINNNNSSNNSDDTTIKFKIQVGHAGTDREKENGYAQTYKIDYAIDDATGTRPQITKDQAKVLHVMLCRHVPTEFDGQVRVRQTIGTVQLEKDVSGLSTVLS
jgi:Methyltransferase domain